MDEEERNMRRLAAQFSTVGLELAASIAIGFIGGFYLDRYLETSPWFTIILGVSGLVAGVRFLIRVVRKTDMDKL